jgi:hypothetical protein
MVPVRVGPHAETFPVHKAILRKSEYFRKALDGEFREAGEQAIDLPEEDPDIFSFVVAYLYEEKFVPIKALSTALVVEPDKGKGKEVNEDESPTSESGSESAGSVGSDESARSRRRREQRRRRVERAWEASQRKQPGRHRPECNCTACVTEAIGAPCWSCGATRRPPPPRNHRYGPGLPPVVIARNIQPYPPPPRPNRHRRRGSRNEVLVVEEPVFQERMSAEDLRTWAQAYSLSVEVYVCASRYLMDDFKNCISDYIINSFEIAGLDAAVPTVLHSCRALHHGVSPVDPLLKRVFARVGFLSARLSKNFPEETQSFFSENPDLTFLIMKEMIERKEEDRPDDLPPMQRHIPPPPPGPDEIYIQGRRPRDPYW